MAGCSPSHRCVHSWCGKRQPLPACWLFPGWDGRRLCRQRPRMTHRVWNKIVPTLRIRPARCQTMRRIPRGHGRIVGAARRKRTVPDKIRLDRARVGRLIPGLTILGRTILGRTMRRETTDPVETGTRIAQESDQSRFARKRSPNRPRNSSNLSRVRSAAGCRFTDPTCFNVFRQPSLLSTMFR